VNAHTHLELSGFDALPARGGFPRWALRVGLKRALSSSADLARAAAGALDDLMAEGVSCVGEVATVGASAPALAQRDVCGVWYQEAIDPSWRTSRSTLRRATTAMALGGQTTGLTHGLFPHAPYSVSGALFAASAQIPTVSLATHVSETRWETGLFAGGSGLAGVIDRILFGRRLQRSRARSPVSWLAGTGFLGPRTALIHATHVDEADVELIRRCGARVVVCPRSSTYFREGPVDVARLLAAGITVGIGTDSPASAGGPSIREELRTLARRQPGLSPRELLLMATEGGAAALGRSGCSGVLAVGARADVTLIDVPDSRRPLSSVLSDAPSRLLLLAGRIHSEA
jgi:cytosine/adenosine deaminase-related metal-dependent hydrolase